MNNPETTLRDNEHVISIDGVPVAQGSMKSFQNKKTGKSQTVHSSKKLMPWRKHATKWIRWQLDRFSKPVLPGTPLEMTVIFKMPRIKKERYYCDVAPDLDKLIRAIGDSLTDAEAFVDDSDICVIHAIKRHARVHETPGVLLSIRPITEAEEPEIFRQLELKGEELTRVDASA